jgi:hypothetical protein
MLLAANGGSTRQTIKMLKKATMTMNAEEAETLVNNLGSFMHTLKKQ